MSNLASIVVGIFILVFVAPLIVISASSGTWGGYFFAVLLGVSMLLFVPFFSKVAKSGERWAEIKRIEEGKQQKRMSLLCKSLSQLSSVIVKCPKCQWTFLRTDALDVHTTKEELLRLYPDMTQEQIIRMSKYGHESGLSSPIMEIFRRTLRESGYPSSFKCPKCGQMIIRSREPSAMCKARNERASGERLLDCTYGKCSSSDRRKE